jgi:hypothetical protein
MSETPRRTGLTHLHAVAGQRAREIEALGVTAVALALV